MTNTADTTQLEQPIALSDAGAVRAFDRLSVNAAALLMGMIRVTSKTGGGEAVIAQAAASMGMPRKPAVQGFNELRRCGLLRQREDNVLILHRLFSSYGHELSRRKQNGGAVGHVVQLSREIA